MTRRQVQATDQRGFALFSTLLLLLLLGAVGSAGVLYSILDLRSTTHYTTGNQALYAAESGIQHGLSSINSVGVIDFQKDIVQHWDSIYGSVLKAMPNDADFQYQVAVVADVANPANAGSLTATGFAPSQGRRVITVKLRRGGVSGAFGAMHLTSDTVGTTFDGNMFSIDGNDHDMYGNLAAGGGAHPGISTRNDSVANMVRGSLSGWQNRQVQGLGFSMQPLTPSVQTTGGPGTANLDQMVADILARPGVVSNNTGGFNTGTTTVFGAVSAPQITHLTNADVNVSGNLLGAGILIADGSVEITGSIDFVGWIIVRGNTVVRAQSTYDDDYSYAAGRLVVKGSMWASGFDVEPGGAALVDYCSSCVKLADGAGAGGNFPDAMHVLSWQEVL